MDYKALLSGLIGTLIGALVSISTLVVQTHYQEKREATKLVFETAFKDYELRFRHATENTPRRFPFPVILAYHQKMMKLLDRDHLVPQSAAEIVKEFDAMLKAIEQADQERRTIGK